MRVLVVDPDVEFGNDLMEQLEAGGVDALHANSPEQMAALMRIHSVDAVVIDLSLRRMDGFVVARQLRVDVSAHDLEIALMSPRHRQDSPEVSSLMSDVQARYFSEKPVDVAALLAVLQSPRPVVEPTPESASPTLAPAPMGRQFKPAPGRSRPKGKFNIDWGHARMLLSLWVERSSGVVSVATSTGTERVSISNGGLVDPDDRAVLKRILRGAKYAFDAKEVMEHGDWARMGRLIFKGASAASDDRTLRKYQSAVPEKSQHGELIRSLPLSKDSRRFIAKVDGVRTVCDVLEFASVSAGDVSSEIEALVQLKLLEFVAAERSSVAEILPVPAAVLDLDQAGSVVVDAVDSDAAIIQRLERELRTIQDAVPAVVLGVPQDSDQSIIDGAANRMRLRYAEMIARRTGDKRVRELAFQICKRVDEAHRSFHSVSPDVLGVPPSKKDWEVDEITLLLEEGRGFIQSSEWAAADHALTKAHEKRLDNVPVLANLGWARLHNPDIDLEKRTEEGRDFLLLAEQFDPHDGDGQYYLAQVLVASGRLDAAEQRASRAMNAMQDDPRRVALHRQIRVKIAKLSEAGKG